MENTNLGSLIKNARLDKGYSQKKLANLCGISAIEVRRIETGQTSHPQELTLKPICSILDIDFNKILEKFGYPNSKETNIENVSLGTIIKNARLDKGYSQEYISNLCGISHVQISNIENGKTLQPRQLTLELLCSILDVDLKEILMRFGYLNCKSSKVSLGTTIKNARLNKGYSTKYFSSLCKISKVALWEIESDRVKPHLSTLKSICSALDIDYDKAIELISKSL